MKQSLFAMTVSCLVALTGWAAAPADCGDSCSLGKGLNAVEEAMKDSTTKEPVPKELKEATKHKACPEGGVETLQVGDQLEGRLMSAGSLIPKIQEKLKQEAQNLKIENQCGSCRQENQIGMVTISRPKTPDFNATCANQPNQVFAGEFKNEQDAADFVKETLQGKGEDGKRLQAGCPDPCSYYVFNGLTSLPSGRVKANLVVQCGMPRSSVFAKYVFNGALVRQWSCQ